MVAHAADDDETIHDRCTSCNRLADLPTPEVHARERDPRCPEPQLDEDVDYTAGPIPKACEHCSAEAQADLWVCREWDSGLPVYLCSSCHHANHRDPLTGEWERDLDEPQFNYRRFQELISGDD